ncbi:MAG: hypothetical protein M1167_02625 [Chloroflexi bacterium]|nr:hypothetical protein [Chloroflexota bacterium]
MSKIALAQGISWRQPVVFAAATAVCTVLAIWAVVLAPVESSTGAITGVSGLYLAAAVYVPLALWFGVWGCLAGYLSCIFMGIYFGYPLPFVMVWALADFFESFVPLLIYRSLKIKPTLELKRPKLTYGLNALLALVLVGSASALMLSLTSVFFATFVASIAILIVQASVEDRKTWITWLIVGVFVASLTSGLFGVGALLAFGNISSSAFPTVFLGWVLGDIIVLATLGTVLTVGLTPIIVKSKIYVQRFFS